MKMSIIAMYLIILEVGMSIKRISRMRLGPSKTGLFRRLH